MKSVTSFAVSAVLFLFASPICATPVTIDFNNGTMTDQGYAAFDFFYGSGSYVSGGSAATWQEDGINVRFQGYGDIPNYTGIAPADFQPQHFQNLSSNDPGADPFVTYDMTIARQDGGLFDFTVLNAGRTYESFMSEVVFTPEGGTPGPDSLITYKTLLGPSLKLVGTKADGTVVTGYGTTKTAGNLSTGFTGALSYLNNNYFDPMAAIFSPDTLATFTGLTELVLQVAPIYDQAMQRMSAIQGLIDLGAPTEVLTALSQCGFNDCTIPGLGSFTFAIYDFGSRNDFRNVWIDQIGLDLVGSGVGNAGGSGGGSQTPVIAPSASSAPRSRRSRCAAAKWPAPGGVRNGRSDGSRAPQRAMSRARAARSPVAISVGG